MSDPFQAEFREKIQVKYNNSYLVKDRLKSLHELRIHYFSCSRGMLLVQQEVSASLPNLTVLDVRGDYLYRDDIRARFSLSPDCEILL